MITFFTHCRAWDDEFGDIQNRAVDSWQRAVPGCEVILMGNEEGTGSAAVAMGAIHAPCIKRNDHDTPLVSDLFETADAVANYDLLCEISSDIVLDGSFMKALHVISGVDLPLVVGQRYDRRQDGSVTLHPPTAADYFVYKRGTLGEIPPFAVGRTAYDNWLVWAAVERWGLMVIDATGAIVAEHQYHTYREYGTREKMLQSAERAENIRLARATGCNRWYGTNEAPFVLRDGKVVLR